MARHDTYSAADMHALHFREYADEIARLAAVPSDFVDDTPFNGGDLFKAVLQLSDNTLWILTQINPSVVWVALGGGGGGGTPGGVDGQIQYNDTGAFAGSPNLLWDETQKIQTAYANIDQQGGTAALPFVPKLLGSVVVGTNPRLMTVAANYAYVIDSFTDDLRIFDVTDPTNPELVNPIPLVFTGTNLRGIAVLGRYIYLTDATSSKFFVVDAIDKSDPKEVGSVVLSGAIRGVRVSGKTAFMTGNDGASGIISVDVSNPAEPREFQTLNTGDGMRIELDLVGNILYVCSIGASNNVRTYDITDPSNMLLLSQWDAGNDAWGIRVQGRYAYVLSSQDGKFQIYDVVDPGNVDPVPDGEVTGLATGMRAFTMSGNFAYLSNQDDDSLKVIDVSDPTAPVVVGTATIDANAVSVFLVGKLCYVLDNVTDTMKIYDVGGLQVQNMNVGAVDAGDLNVRRDGFFGNNVSANSGIFGQGGILSDGSIATAGDFILRRGQRLFLDGGDTDTFIEQLNPNEIRLFAGGDLVAPAKGGTLLQAHADGTNLRVNIAARFQEGHGGLVASANIVTLPPSGNVHNVIGTITINEIVGTGWQQGAKVTLIFDEALTLTDSSGGTDDLFLRGGLDLDVVAGDVLTLEYENPGWKEFSKTTLNLTNLKNLEFGVSGVTPAIGTPSIYNTAIGLNFDVAAGDGYNFQVNGGLEYEFTTAHVDFKFNHIVDLGRLGLATTTAPATTEIALWADAGGMNFNVDGGEDFTFQVSGGTILTISSNSLLLAGRDIEGVIALEFSSGFAPADTIANIHTTPSRMVYNAIAGQEFRFQIEGIPVLELRDTEADFEGNNLVNVGDINGHLNASRADNVVEVYSTADLVDLGFRYELLPGVEYVIMAPLTLDKGFQWPDTGGAFQPTVVRSSAKGLNTITYTATGNSIFLESVVIESGQVVLQNITITNANTQIFANINHPSSQTAKLLELDDANISGFADGTSFQNCIFNANNGSFWSDCGTFELIDAECTLADMFQADFTDTNNPVLRVRASNPAPISSTFFTIRDSRLSSHPNQGFFMFHTNLDAGSTEIRVNGVQASQFTPATGSFYATEQDSIQSLADSAGSPGVQTLVNSAGHTLQIGDTITQSGFTTETQMNGTFVVQTVAYAAGVGVSYEIIAVFSGTDTGTWEHRSQDQADPFINAFDNPGQPDSAVTALLTMEGNTAETDIPAADALILVDANVNWVGENLERFTVATDGIATYIGLETKSLALNANANLNPASATKKIGARLVKIGTEALSCTFNNILNEVVDTDHTRQNGDAVSFRFTAGTLPAELRTDAVYYVVNADAVSFDLSYTPGGPVVAFTDDGTAPNIYDVCRVGGWKDTADISSANPQGVQPGDLTQVVTGDRIVLAVLNTEDGINVLVNEAANRMLAAA